MHHVFPQRDPTPRIQPPTAHLPEHKQTHCWSLRQGLHHRPQHNKSGRERVSRVSFHTGKAAAQQVQAILGRAPQQPPPMWGKCPPTMAAPAMLCRAWGRAQDEGRGQHVQHRAACRAKRVGSKAGIPSTRTKPFVQTERWPALSPALGWARREGSMLQHGRGPRTSPPQRTGVLDPRYLASSLLKLQLAFVLFGCRQPHKQSQRDRSPILHRRQKARDLHRQRQHHPDQSRRVVLLGRA
mmetsp:Transcript_28905/g.96192  ORF Transcript_28905/g.96192 Transcript_28905/m.96192 type:complete len:240 (+) Transcript_28905:4681-5400(+)